jgi:hypothetical protein
MPPCICDAGSCPPSGEHCHTLDGSQGLELHRCRLRASEQQMPPKLCPMPTAVVELLRSDPGLTASASLLVEGWTLLSDTPRTCAAVPCRVLRMLPRRQPGHDFGSLHGAADLQSNARGSYPPAASPHMTGVKRLTAAGHGHQLRRLLIGNDARQDGSHTREVWFRDAQPGEVFSFGQHLQPGCCITSPSPWISADNVRSASVA